MTTHYGIEVGEYVGGGSYSSVYAHPTDPDKVIMFGVFSDDLLKLNLFNVVGALHSVTIISQDRHASILTRMTNERDSDSAYETIRASEKALDRIRGAHDYSDRERIVLDFATDPAFGEKTAQMCEFLIANPAVHWGFDNHCGNWLIDPNGEVIPADVFNGGCGAGNAYDQLTSYISDKTTSRDTSES